MNETYYTHYTPEELADIFERAADELHTRGHHKGAYIDEETGGVCLFGACLIAVGSTLRTTVDALGRNKLEFLYSLADSNPRWGHLVSSMNVRIPVDPSLAATGDVWNDLPETTQDQVEELLKSVAKDLRNGP